MQEKSWKLNGTKRQARNYAAAFKVGFSSSFPWNSTFERERSLLSFSVSSFYVIHSSLRAVNLSIGRKSEVHSIKNYVKFLNQYKVYFYLVKI